MKKNDTKSKLKFSVLVAEDDQFYVDLFQTKLKEAGIDVAVAKDGKETMKTLHTKKPDLLILDILMPVMDGYEVLEAMKKNEKLKDVKIVVLTNLGANGETAKKVKKLGADEYIIKANISIEEMVNRVKAYLK